MKIMRTLIVGTLFAFIGAIAGAMLTTDYSTMRKNGESYLPAVRAGLNELWALLANFVSSLWFIIPVAVLALVVVTAKVTLWLSKPSQDIEVQLGLKMNRYLEMATHDQRYRQFSSIYKDSIRICHEFDAFMVQLRSHGLPTPKPPSKNADEWVDLCYHYFSAVGPHLRNGDLTSAVSVAKGFSD